MRFQSLRDQFGDVKFEPLEKMSDKLPYGFNYLYDWISNRQAPKHREHIEKLLRSCGCYELDGYIRVTHALSLNDTFWIKPVSGNLKWADVSLYENEFDETIAKIAFEGGLYGEQFTTTSPEFGTDGAYAKCWIKENEDIFLLKRGTSGARNAGLEPYSEMYAAQLAKVICPDYVNYEVVKYRGEIASKCKAFTNENIGFAAISKCVGKESTTDDILKFYAELGCEEAFRRMVVLDAITLNTDRHRGNYGIIFDNDTLEPIKMAPIFDNNQSLLPYAEKEDFLHIEEYLPTRPTRIGRDFNEIAHAMMTPGILADLKNLRGFKFDRDVQHPLPEERLLYLEKVVNLQIENVIYGKRLYIEDEGDRAEQYFTDRRNEYLNSNNNL